MLVRLLALIFLAAALPAAAQTVDIRSGEHADFTRLVFYFPDRPSVALARTDGGLVLSTGGEHRFDTSDAFTRIPRDRVASLGTEPGALAIDLNCECAAEISEYKPGMFVLDVRDGPPKPEPTRAEAPPMPRPGSAPKGRIARLDVDRPVFTLETAPTPLLPGFAETPEARDGTNKVTTNLPQPAGQIVEETARQVSRAAAQGLLDADLSKLKTVIERDLPTPVEATDRADEVEVADAGPLLPNDRTAHVRIRTSIDRDLGMGPMERVQAADGGGCLPDSSFDVGNWADGDDDGSAISRHRAALLDDSDSVDPGAVTDLARYLISLSFGAEALAVLDAYPAVAEEARLLRTLADIVDDGEAETPGPLQAQIGCPTSAALWAALAGPSLPAAEDIDTDAVTAAFSALPLRLRRHLGPALAERFLSAGMSETSASLRDAIARAPGNPGPAFELLEAKIDLDAGRTESADARLDRLVDEERAPTALALQVERKNDAREALDLALIENVAATAHELKGTPLGERLKTAEIRARAISGDYLGALDELDRAGRSGSVEAGDVGPMRTAVFADAAEHAEDAIFLRLAFRAGSVLGTEDDEMQARRALARRLMAHDLTDQARELVNASDIVPTVDDRLILAEAALADGRTDIATGYIMGLTDDRAEALRALLRGTVQQPEPSAAQTAETDAGDTAEPGGLLTQNRALLGEAQEARQRLELLLADAADRS